MYIEIAQLMRDGAALRPQEYCAMFSLPDEDVLKSCAMGAMFEAYFGSHVYDPSLSAELNKAFPALLESVPVELWPEGIAQLWQDCGKVSVPTLRILVMFMNDTAKWTREAIADWVESLQVGPWPDALAVLAWRNMPEMMAAMGRHKVEPV